MKAIDYQAKKWTNLLTLHFFWGICLLGFGHTSSKAQILGGMLKNIPSPNESIKLMKKLGYPYKATLLADVKPSTFSKFTTPYYQALMMGVYATDLGYVHINWAKKEQDRTLKAQLQMERELAVTQYFPLRPILKFWETNQLDSLLAETSKMDKNISDHFLKEGQRYLSILFATGKWLGSIYFLTFNAKNKPNHLLDIQLGEDKIALEQLLLALSFYEYRPSIKKLIQDLNRLSKVFDNISFKYTKAKKRVKVTSAKVPPKTVVDIFNITVEIRNKIIQTKY